MQKTSNSKFQWEIDKLFYSPRKDRQGKKILKTTAIFLKNANMANKRIDLLQDLSRWCTILFACPRAA